MSQFLAVTTTMVLTIMLWGFGRKLKTPFASKASTGFQPSQTELAVDFGIDSNKSSDRSFGKMSFPMPKNSRERILLKKHFKKLMSFGPDEKLLVMEHAISWGDPSVIPLLKQGLKDMDSRVVIKAAEAISKFRSYPPSSTKKKLRVYPLNVFLMR